MLLKKTPGIEDKNEIEPEIKTGYNLQKNARNKRLSIKTSVTINNLNLLITGDCHAPASAGFGNSQ
jgi:hypothetical protein